MKLWDISYIERMLQIDFVPEFQLTNVDKQQLTALLRSCFSECDYEGRIYFKQMPHYRLLARQAGQIVGQLALDFRAMNLNGELVQVLGIADLAVLPEFQKQGIGKRLMHEAIKLAENHPNQIDFLYLVTDLPGFYEPFGFKSYHLQVTWLKINARQTLGIGNEKVNDCKLMVKPISGKIWQDGKLDLLGYWY